MQIKHGDLPCLGADDRRRRRSGSCSSPAGARRERRPVGGFGSWWLRPVPGEVGGGQVVPAVRRVHLPFVPDVFDCRRNGRPDDDYLKFRWSPGNCRLPRSVDHHKLHAQVQSARSLLSSLTLSNIYICRFDGGDLLRRWRGKTVMFVGDSLSMNQWVSLACMLHAAAPAPVRATFTSGEPVSAVRFEVS